MVFFNLPFLDHSGLLLGRGAGKTRDFGSVKLELRKKKGLLYAELLRLQMTVLTDSLGTLEFRSDVLKENKSSVEEVKALQKAAGNEKRAWNGLE